MRKILKITKDESVLNLNSDEFLTFKELIESEVKDNNKWKRLLKKNPINLNFKTLTLLDWINIDFSNILDRFVV